MPPPTTARSQRALGVGVSVSPVAFREARGATFRRVRGAAAGRLHYEGVRRDQRAISGLARVSTVSFLAARAAPSGGFWISLAGGVALARCAQRYGARGGFGASLAAMLETVAVIGPARFGVPLTQAMTAPWIGRLEARGASPLTEFLACSLVRILHNLATTAFFIWVILGGLDAYAGTYDALPFFPGGVTAALGASSQRCRPRR